MKTLDIVIPVYNEQERLNKTYKALYKGLVCRGLKLKTIIFVNDGSRDKTRQIIKNEINKLEKNTKTKVKLISYRQNKGKGYAIKRGLMVSGADYILLTDADMSTPLTEIKKFMPLVKKNCDLIFGTRKNGQSTVLKHQPLYRELLGRGYTRLTNFILNTSFTDFTCGFKLLSKETRELIAPAMNINGWSYDVEIIYLAVRFGLKTAEKSVLWSNDERSKVKLWKDLPLSFYELLKIRARFLPQDLHELLVKTVKEPAIRVIASIK